MKIINLEFGRRFKKKEKKKKFKLTYVIDKEFINFM